MHQANITIFIGPTGSGKTFMCEALDRDGFYHVGLATTRARRLTLKHDPGYYFKKPEFDERVQDGDIVCPTQFSNGVWYGIPLWGLSSATRPIVMAMDITMASAFKNWAKGHRDTDQWEFVCLDVPETVRRARLALRGDSHSEVERRIEEEKDIYSPENVLKVLGPHTRISTSRYEGASS